MDVDAAIARVKNTAAPANSLRVGADTPCAMPASAGTRRPAAALSALIVIEASMNPGRVTVVLVGESLG
jgi:hypothetical protein